MANEPAHQYDDEASDGAYFTRERLKSIEGGGESTDRRTGHLSVVKGDDEDTDAPGATGSKAPKKAKPDLQKAEKKAASQKPKDGTQESSGKGGRFRPNRVQTVSGVSGLLFFGLGGFWMFTPFQGMLQFIDFFQNLRGPHFSQNEELGNDRGSLMIWNLRNGNPQRSRLGRQLNGIADRVDAKIARDHGIRPVHDRTTGRFLGYEIIDETTAGRSDVIKQLIREGIQPTNTIPDFARGPGGNNDPVRGRLLSAQNANRRTIKSFVKATIRGTDLENIPGSAATRIAIRRYGADFHPIKGLRRRATQSIVDYYRDVKERRAERRRDGVEVPERRNATADDDPDGDGESNPDPEAENAAREANEALDEIAEVDGGSSTSPNVLQRLRNSLVSRFGRGAAAITGVVCQVRSFGDEAEALQHTNTFLTEARIAMEVAAAGSMIMDGKNPDMNVDELGAHISDLKDDRGVPWSAAKSIQHNRGRRPARGPDIPNSARPNQVGEKPLLFRMIDRIPGIGAACAVDNAAGNLPVIKQASAIGGAAINGVLGIFGVSIEDFAGMIIAFLAGNGANSFAVGPELGALADYGARIAANDQAIGMGGTRLNRRQAAAIDAEIQEAQYRDRLEKSFIARTFDLYDSKSVAATTLRELPDSPSQAVASFLNAPSRLVSMAFKPASAQVDRDFDYGIPRFGFTIEEQNDPRFQDPYINFDRVENEFGIQRLNDEFGDCFLLTIDPETGGIITNDSPRYDQIPNDCRTDANDDGIEDNLLLLSYRFYIADSLAAYGITCYHGDEESCRQLIEGVQEAPAGAPAVPIDGSGRGQDTSAMQCSVGTDGGVAPTPDHNIMIRTCIVDGVRVNVLIEANLRAALDGANAAGIPLGAGDTYRSYDTQVERRRTNCGTSRYALYEMPAGDCNPPTARPGTSMHEWGLAIDFRCGATGIPSRSSPCFQWLNNNTNVHHLINLESEPWHWSSSGN